MNQSRGGTNFCPGAVRPGIVLKDFVQDMSRTNFFGNSTSPKNPKSKQFPLTNKKLEDTSRTKIFFGKKLNLLQENSVFFSLAWTIPGQISPGHSQDGQLQDKKPCRPQSSRRSELELYFWERDLRVFEWNPKVKLKLGNQIPPGIFSSRQIECSETNIQLWFQQIEVLYYLG